MNRRSKETQKRASGREQANKKASKKASKQTNKTRQDKTTRHKMADAIARRKNKWKLQNKTPRRKRRPTNTTKQPNKPRTAETVSPSYCPQGRPTRRSVVCRCWVCRCCPLLQEHKTWSNNGFEIWILRLGFRLLTSDLWLERFSIVFRALKLEF